MIALTPASGNRPSLEEIGQTEAINYLLPESMNFPEVRGAGLSTLVSMVRAARLLRLTKGDLDESAELLSGVLP